MKVKITGDYRDIANSAWISTIKEIRAAARTDDDAKKVVSFLVAHQHTSPFESVTATFFPEAPSPSLLEYSNCKYARVSSKTGNVTIDLLNMLKVTHEHKLFGGKPWSLFESERPELAAMCSEFKPLGSKVFTENASIQLGEHGMEVELISFHDVGERALSRATWRVKCPLSIAVQILRHRAGSYNMVSGRYKTIYQELVPAVDDCSKIFEKMGADLNRYLGGVDPIIAQYDSMMKRSRAAKKIGIISAEEYKRVREFARFVLPEGRMTELYITYYLDDFHNNYVVLRNSKHSQIEHIWLAQEMERVLLAA